MYCAYWYFLWFGHHICLRAFQKLLDKLQLIWSFDSHLSTYGTLFLVGFLFPVVDECVEVMDGTIMCSSWATCWTIRVVWAVCIHGVVVVLSLGGSFICLCLLFHFWWCICGPWLCGWRFCVGSNKFGVQLLLWEACHGGGVVRKGDECPGRSLSAFLEWHTT